MWQRFTERARRVVFFAQEEAGRLGENYVSTEHLLLGLIREDAGVAARVLSLQGVSLERACEAVESMIGRGEKEADGPIGLTTRAEQALDLARDEARRLSHHYIGTEHLLLGLVRDGGLPIQVLERLGVNPEKVHSQVLQVISEPSRPQLGPLVRVVPLAQTQEQQGFEATLLSLEVYAAGFLANMRLRFVDQVSFDSLNFNTRIRARDDRDTPYQEHTYVVHWPHVWEWRLVASFAPELAPLAQALHLEVPAQRWRQAGEERVAGPWTFVVVLPPVEEA